MLSEMLGRSNIIAPILTVGIAQLCSKLYPTGALFTVRKCICPISVPWDVSAEPAQSMKAPAFAEPRFLHPIDMKISYENVPSTGHASWVRATAIFSAIPAPARKRECVASLP